MNNPFAGRLVALRKEQNLTQEMLAAKLGVTYQAVSKWENGQTYPDISLLPTIAAIFGIGIDSLLGYIPASKRISIYEDKYRDEAYYWGLEPSGMCYEVLRLRPPVRHYTLLDIGCGEGKDAVFFAKNGYMVSAFDIADAGLEKAKRLADYHKADINVFKADALDFRLHNTFDIIFSSGVLHYIPEASRKDIFDNYKAFTSEKGLNALNVFVRKPFLDAPPDAELTETPWRSGELFLYYHDWLFHKSEERIFDCSSGGLPHQHAMNVLIAEKTQEG